MNRTRIDRYIVPDRWLRYDVSAVAGLLVEAKTAAGILNRLPHLPRWIEQVHEEQLRLEAVGTSRIEGAEFTRREEEDALARDSVADTGLTHSQRQLRAADATYRWLRSRPAGLPVTAELILDTHRRIVTGCDDDHCEPGALRRAGANVIFGKPACRGAEGGAELTGAFGALEKAITREFRGHDRIIQALAVHYHIGSMHPFDDGNGRTARAVEAFMLREAGVNDMVMVSLSNYYYEHSEQYREALYESRQSGHDLTPFLRFALPAISERCDALASEIAAHNKRMLYLGFAHSLFGKLRSPRRRALADRQLRIIEVLLGAESVDLDDLVGQVLEHYMGLKFFTRALVRDLKELIDINAIVYDNGQVSVDLDWPRRFSESELLERYERMRPAASASHPATMELARLLGRRRSGVSRSARRPTA